MYTLFKMIRRDWDSYVFAQEIKLLFMITTGRCHVGDEAVNVVRLSG